MKCISIRPSRLLTMPRACRVRCNPKPYEELYQAIVQANITCNESLDELECAIAWDIVDDINRGLLLREERSADPLENFCQSNEDADECKIYDV